MHQRTQPETVTVYSTDIRPDVSATRIGTAALAVLIAVAGCSHPHGTDHLAHHGHPAAGSAGTGLPVARRLSTERLDAFTAQLQADVDRGRIPGAVVLVARDGRVVYEKAIGRQDANAGTPMRVDSLFRIYSMTKPIVSVATMMLVERGRIALADPVSQHLPELRGLKVGVEKAGADGKPTLELVAAQREMTVQDLLRHTSGLTYGVFGKSLVKSEYDKARVDANDITNGELLNRLAKVPLHFQPGSTWEYGRSTDVLGALIERVSGQPLDTFLRENLFVPLKMTDTDFWVDPARQDRIAEPLAMDPDSKQPITLLDIRRKPSYLAGGQGLVSSARDYWRFQQMVLNGGVIDGVRILSPKTVRYMLSDHLDGIRGPAYLPGPGYGFGLGYAVRLTDGGPAVPGSAGDAHWGGYGGTAFWIDPRERMVAVLMLQAPNQRNYYRAVFRNRLYGSFE